MVEITRELSRKLRNLSFIATILVIYIHTYNVDMYGLATKDGLSTSLLISFEILISHFLAKGAVPMFFFISAFLFYHNFTNKYNRYHWYREKLRKRIKTLIIPYFFWNLIAYIIFLLPHFFSFLRPVMRQWIRNINTTDFLFSIIFYKYNYVFWFMFDLILSVFICAFIHAYFRKYMKFVLILSTILFFIPHLSISLLSNGSLLFYILGIVISENDDLFKLYFEHKRTNVLGGWIVSMFFLSFNNIALNVYANKLMLLVCFYGLWNLEYFVVLTSKLDNVMECTFMIYAIHPFLLETIEKLIYIMIGKSVFGATLDYLIAPSLTLLIAYNITYRWKKYLPISYKWVSGER